MHPPVPGLPVDSGRRRKLAKCLPLSYILANGIISFPFESFTFYAMHFDHCALSLCCGLKLLPPSYFLPGPYALSAHSHATNDPRGFGGGKEYIYGFFGAEHSLKIN